MAERSSTRLSSLDCERLRLHIRRRRFHQHPCQRDTLQPERGTAGLGRPSNGGPRWQGAELYEF